MIIGVCGLIGGGKGTVADILVDEFGFVKYSFADSLKDGVAAMFDYPRHLLEGDTEESRIWRETPDPFWSSELNEEITPRRILQLVGTDCLRDNFFDGVWVSLLKKKLKESNHDIVIPDVRFVNEINMIKDVGGEIWQVWRNVPEWSLKYMETKIEPEGVHTSEYSWMLGHKDTTIFNDTTIEDLKQKVFYCIKNITKI